MTIANTTVTAVGTSITITTIIEIRVDGMRAIRKGHFCLAQIGGTHQCKFHKELLSVLGLDG